MKYTATEQKLIDAMAEMDIIDCHEHLPPEKVRTGSPQDVFTLFSHYTRQDLFSAGMDREVFKEGINLFFDSLPNYDSLFNIDISLEKRWKMFKPYWQAIRFGSYAHAVLLTTKIVYGFDDINDKTYRPLSERIAAENTPGIYKRILCDRCRIRASMTQCSSTKVERPLVPVMPGLLFTQIRKREQLDDIAGKIGKSAPKNLDDYLTVVEAYLRKWITEGTIGIKITSQHNLPPNRKAAEYSFKRMFNGEELKVDSQGFEVLENYLMHQLIDIAAELNLVIAVHAGIWGDFRNIDSKHMLTLAPAHPKAQFDLYHLGMPSVRDTIVIGKNLPNVNLNLCWTHIISQVQTCSAINELIDQVPVNKILAFGGDYKRPIEKVVGHLHMARENYAHIFGARIDQEKMSLSEALEILKLWFWNNPLKLYTRLKIDPT